MAATCRSLPGRVRGGISIALALSLPDSSARSAILVATYAVVLFSIVVQGATLPVVRAPDITQRLTAARKMSGTGIDGKGAIRCSLLGVISRASFQSDQYSATRQSTGWENI
jgi:hypothetical protein